MHLLSCLCLIGERLFIARGNSRALSGKQRGEKRAQAVIVVLEREKALKASISKKKKKKTLTGSQNSADRPYASLVMRAVILSKWTASLRPSRFWTCMVKGEEKRELLRSKGNGAARWKKKV